VSLTPVSIFSRGAEEEKAETARLVSYGSAENEMKQVHRVMSRPCVHKIVTEIYIKKTDLNMTWAISWQRPTTNINSDVVSVKLIEITE